MKSLILLILLTFINTENPYNNSLCVTYENLRAYNYTQFIDFYDSKNVFPENYCYGVLTYNITVSDYDNIVKKNLEAFKLYRRYLNQYYLYNVTDKTSQISMSDGCLPIFRYIACYSQFPACVEHENNTISTNGICESFCSKFFNRCGAYMNFGICENNTTAKYCAGVDPGSMVKIKFALLIILLILIL